MIYLFFVPLTLSCGLAVIVWGRSAFYRSEQLRRVERELSEMDETADSTDLERKQQEQRITRTNFYKEVHSGALYLCLFAASFMILAFQSLSWAYLYAVVMVLALVSAFWFGRKSLQDALLLRERFRLERKVEEVIAQADSAPKVWAERLAPEELPTFDGFQTGRVYQAGSGLMAGDFYDIYQTSDTRIAAVLGDVAGHGVESAMTAFLAKFLLRTLLSKHRDPAEALEQLNRQMFHQMFTGDRPEEFISLVVLVFDIEASTLRYASAGHPTAWLWHEREVQPLRSTGPLALLDEDSTFYSREIPLHPDDLVLLYSDGLSEVRREATPDEGESEQFGQDRIARLMRNDPTLVPQDLCLLLLEEAKKFSLGNISDDLAIFAIRWTGIPEVEDEDVAVV